MTWTKRSLDVVVAIGLGLCLIPVMAMVAGLVAMLDGRPVFYRSQRVTTGGRRFGLIKFRTMRHDPLDAGVSGADKTIRITRTGSILRRSRLDELPQLWNVLRGDMSFVGPRPPLPRYVDMFPDLYERVLQSRPGITGLATLVFHRHEARILGQCHTADQTEAAYIRRCIPVKARLDLIYGERRSLCWDLWLMLATIAPVSIRSDRILGRIFGWAVRGQIG